MHYPDVNHIAPCGTYLKNRKCDDSLNKKVKNKVYIRFTPKDYKTNDDFIVDYGQEYGSDKKPYGWNKDISSNIKQRRNASKIVLETLVEFNPDPYSKHCLNPSPEKNCEPVKWYAKVGSGLFIVKLFIGDPNIGFKSDLKVNNKSFTKNKFIEKNKLEIVEEVVESIDDFIEVYADCQEDCEYSMNRLSAIEIIPYSFYKDSISEENVADNNEISLPCGIAYKGGRCDTGPNVLHCVYNDATVAGASFCNGEKILKSISSSYMCKEQIGHYKCVNKVYSNNEECNRFCPTKCKEEKCQ